MPRVLGSSHGSRFTVAKLRTIRSTHTQRLPSKCAGDDLQDKILRDDTNSKLWRFLTTHRRTDNYDVGLSSKNVSTTTVELGMEQPVRTEYGSDKGLIITGDQETADTIKSQK